jgi:hypothetical protein
MDVRQHFRGYVEDITDAAVWLTLKVIKGENEGSLYEAEIPLIRLPEKDRATIARGLFADWQIGYENGEAKSKLTIGEGCYWSEEDVRRMKEEAIKLESIFESDNESPR